MPKHNSFLRWAGAKAWLVPYIEILIRGHKFNKYVEPFMGGANVFFSLDFDNFRKGAILSDINKELVNAFQMVKKDPASIINLMKTLNNTKEDYYKIRANDEGDNIYRAARFIYLNHTSFNGLYRENRNGKYNVPYGYRTEVYNYEKLYTVSEKLNRATLIQGNFLIVKKYIREGDLVFLDPPYVVSSDHYEGGFIGYNSKLFSLENQKQLSEFADFINDKGAFYILTNAYHKEILNIFSNCPRYVELRRNSLIGGKNAKREKVKEYIFTNLPKGSGEDDYLNLGQTSLF